LINTNDFVAIVHSNNKDYVSCILLRGFSCLMVINFHRNVICCTPTLWRTFIICSPFDGNLIYSFSNIRINESKSIQNLQLENGKVHQTCQSHCAPSWMGCQIFTDSKSI